MKKAVQTDLEPASQKCPCHVTNSSCADMNYAEQYKIIIYNFFQHPDYGEYDLSDFL